MADKFGDILGPLALQSERHLERRMSVVIGGVPRSGKSTVAKAVAEWLNWPLLHSDELVTAWRRAARPHPGPLRKSEGAVQKILLEWGKDNWVTYSGSKIMEGVVFQPGAVSKHSQQGLWHCVFLGYPELQVREKFDEIRRFEAGGRTYTSKLDDEELSRRITGWIRRSRKLREACRQNEQTFYDVGADLRPAVTRCANDILRHIETTMTADR